MDFYTNDTLIKDIFNDSLFLNNSENATRKVEISILPTLMRSKGDFSWSEGVIQKMTKVKYFKEANNSVTISMSLPIPFELGLTLNEEEGKDIKIKSRLSPQGSSKYVPLRTGYVTMLFNFTISKERDSIILISVTPAIQRSKIFDMSFSEIHEESSRLFQTMQHLLNHTNINRSFMIPKNLLECFPISFNYSSY